MPKPLNPMCQIPPELFGEAKPERPALTDTFRGDDANLIASIEALIALSDDGALVPHGIGGGARALLSSAAVRLKSQGARVPDAFWVIEDFGGDGNSLNRYSWLNGRRTTPDINVADKYKTREGAQQVIDKFHGWNAKPVEHAFVSALSSAPTAPQVEPSDTELLDHLQSIGVN